VPGFIYLTFYLAKSTARISRIRSPDLSGILHGFFDILGDIPRQAGGFQIIDLSGSTMMRTSRPAWMHMPG
jgi:hypothetical protein